jgi:hypothetical protein
VPTFLPNKKTHFNLFKDHGKTDNQADFEYLPKMWQLYSQKTSLNGVTILQDGSITCSIESLRVHIEVMQALFKLTDEKLAPTRQLYANSQRELNSVQ